MSPEHNFDLPHPNPLLIVISGPSGVGKDTVLQRMKERGLPFHFVVTANTRAPRENEVHGKDYWFVTKEEFARMIETDRLIEYAIVYGDYKGIPKDEVRQALTSGQDVVLRIDVQGAETIRKLAPEALLIFLTTASEEELVRRLEMRKTETAEENKLRIATARKELQRLGAFDYVIINHEFRLDETVEIIRAIIEAEHHRVNPRKVEL
jgi:guanylate kinase